MSCSSRAQQQCFGYRDPFTGPQSRVGDGPLRKFDWFRPQNGTAVLREFITQLGLQSRCGNKRLRIRLFFLSPRTGLRSCKRVSRRWFRVSGGLYPVMAGLLCTLGMMTLRNQKTRERMFRSRFFPVGAGGKGEKTSSDRSVRPLTELLQKNISSTSFFLFF